MAIPVYVNIYDLKPTETLWDEVHDGRDINKVDHWTKENIKEDIKINGLKYSLTVDYDGNILNGNARYWVCRELFEEGDERFRYLPVDLGRIAGKYMIRSQEKPFPDVIKEILSFILNQKYYVIPSATEFTEYEIDSDNPNRLERFSEVTEKNKIWNIFTGQNNEGYVIVYQLQREN